MCHTWMPFGKNMRLWVIDVWHTSSVKFCRIASGKLLDQPAVNCLIQQVGLEHNWQITFDIQFVREIRCRSIIVIPFVLSEKLYFTFSTNNYVHFHRKNITHSFLILFFVEFSTISRSFQQFSASIAASSTIIIQSIVRNHKNFHVVLAAELLHMMNLRTKIGAITNNLFLFAQTVAALSRFTFKYTWIENIRDREWRHPSKSPKPRTNVWLCVWQLRFWKQLKCQLCRVDNEIE